MAQDIRRDGLNIVRSDVIAPVEPRMGARAAIQGNRRARTGALFQPFGQVLAVSDRFAGGENDLEQILLQIVAQIEV